MKLLVANWKAQKTFAESQQWLSTVLPQTQSLTQTEIVVCPTISHLAGLAELFQHANGTSLGTQDLSPFPAGSYTGATAAYSLKELGISHAILGHSERRRYFHESDQDVANKVDEALQAGITPIVCVDDEYIASQAHALSSEQLSKCIVAYEDLDAIGGDTPTALDVLQKHIHEIQHEFGGDVTILYGGSITSSNIAPYIPVVDGFLVGSATLDPSSFLGLVATLETTS